MTGTYQNYLKNKNYDILLTGVTVGISPDLRRYLGSGNLANYEDSEVTDILGELYNLADEKMVKEKYEKLQNKYDTDRPYVGLYFNKQIIIHGTNLTTTPNITWFNIFYDIPNWNRKN